MPQSLVTTYVDAAIAQLDRKGLRRRPGPLPAAMLDSTIAPENDWRGRRAIESTVTPANMDALETEIGLPFPPLYRDLLCYRHYVELTGVGLNFEPHLCHDWRETLRRPTATAGLAPAFSTSD